jgi:hypothetical protein
VVAGEIEQPVAVHIQQPASVTFFQDDGVRGVEEWAARIPTGKALTALQKVLIRGRGQATVELFLSG